MRSHGLRIMRSFMGQQIIALMYGQVDADAPEDEKDVLVQLRSVRRALQSLGYLTEDIALTLNLHDASERLRSLRPAMAFNLAETIEGKGSLIHVAPTLLESLGIPYTGASAEAIFLTSHKLRAKKTLKMAGIDTPEWTTAVQALRAEPTFAPPFIVKSIWEHASIGMEDSAVAFSVEELSAEIRRRLRREGTEQLFVESYVEGREFNLALLGGMEDSILPQSLPPAEIRFVDYPEDKPKFVGYRAKWDQSSFEYSRTPRRFDFPSQDAALLADLRRRSVACWELFGLRGYARVDFRVDAEGKPWVLEINTNPCLSPDAGFMAAAARDGLLPDDVIRRIITDTRTNTAVAQARPTSRIKEPNTWAPR